MAADGVEDFFSSLFLGFFEEGDTDDVDGSICMGLFEEDFLSTGSFFFADDVDVLLATSSSSVEDSLSCSLGLYSELDALSTSCFSSCEGDCCCVFKLSSYFNISTALQMTLVCSVSSTARSWPQ